VSFSATTEVWEAIVLEAGAESRLWADCALPSPERELVAVFSPLAEPRFALGLETIYEGYLLHYGRPRLFAPADGDTALLLGDYLYAHGLVRVADLDPIGAVADLAELISLCAQVQADGGDGDGPLWAATASLLGTGTLAEARTALRMRSSSDDLASLARAAAGREEVDRALATHRSRLR
jgi:hypothetical protein